MLSHYRVNTVPRVILRERLLTTPSHERRDHSEKAEVEMFNWKRGDVRLAAQQQSAATRQADHILPPTMLVRTVWMWIDFHHCRYL